MQELTNKKEKLQNRYMHIWKQKSGLKETWQPNANLNHVSGKKKNSSILL